MPRSGTTSRWYLPFLFLIVIWQQSSAQHQRFGIAPQMIVLHGKRQVGTAQAYRLDKHRFASNSYVPYTPLLNLDSTATVKVGKSRPILLPEAIERRIISVDIRFKRNVTEPIEIALPEATAFGETPGSAIEFFG